MNASDGRIAQPAATLSLPGLAFKSAVGAIIATVAALSAFGAIGIVVPGVVGLQGVALSGALGAAVGAAMRGPGSSAARVVGGGIGALVAGYFAVASGEQFLPGTMQWAYAGLTFAAVFAVPTAALVGGLIGLLGAISRPVAN